MPWREEDEKGAGAADTVSSPSRWSESCTEKPRGGIGRCHLGRQDDRRGVARGARAHMMQWMAKRDPCALRAPLPHAKGRGWEGTGR